MRPFTAFPYPILPHLTLAGRLGIIDTPGFSLSEVETAQLETLWTRGGSLTPSMRIAMRDLKLDALFVLYPGSKRHPLGERIEILPASAVVEFRS